MAVFRAPGLKYQGFDGNGDIAASYRLYTYAAGTTTLQTTYTSSTGLTANTNPIILNARGEPPAEIWLSEGVAYKFDLKTSADVSVWSVPEDNIRGINDSDLTLDEWVASGLTPTYISATSFSVVGDQTSVFQVGRRVKTTNTGGTRYGTISSSSFSAGVTTVVITVDSGSLDSGLSDVSLSFLQSTNSSAPQYVGSFSPAITFGGANTGLTYTTRVGRYTKVANRCMFTVYVLLSAKGSSTGSAKVTNLPFTSANITGLNTHVPGSLDTVNTITTNGMTFFIPPNSSEITLSFMSAGARATVTDAHFNNTTEVMISGSYQTA